MTATRPAKVCVSRDHLEDMAFANHAPIEVDYAANRAWCRIDGTEFWAELGEVW